MQSIKVYTMGVDPMPLDGLDINIFVGHASFGIFESTSGKEITFEYNTGDFDCDTLQEALDKGIEIAETYNDCIDEEGNYVKLYPLDFECDVKGIRWTYVHEHLPIISDIEFPFQSDDVFNSALRHGLIQVLDKEVVARSEDYIFRYLTVRFNDKNFKVTFVNDSFHNWSDAE